MIDAHLHVDLLNPAFLKRLAPDVVGNPRKMAEALGKEMVECGVTQALAMGREQGTDEDPLGIRGTLEGDGDFFEDPDRNKMLGRLAERVAEVVDYMGKPERILYGTDWPLVPVRSYRDFIQRTVPEKHWSMVFEMNARKLFALEAQDFISHQRQSAAVSGTR